MSPEFIPKIPEVMNPPKPGPIEVVTEIPTITDYYDGSIKLNVVHVNCKIFLTANDCIHNSNCGWCGSTNSCILGNNLGPMQPCAKSSFIFSPPVPNWNPQVRVVNDNVGGVSMTQLPTSAFPSK